MTLQRERLPAERSGATHVFRLAYSHKNGDSDVMQFYITTNTYPDGRLGEVFMKADRPGSLASGTLDTACTFLSMMLQYGVPLEVCLEKIRHTRFPPNGFTKDPEFPSCSSPLDLLAQYLEKRYGKPKEP